jgi:glycosyltransferase involved in cell wall biosynthesis
VLHVLPHPGGGGETYVDFLSAMPGYRAVRTFLAQNPAPVLSQLTRGIVQAFGHARRHDLLHVHGDAASALCLPLLSTRPSVVTLNGLHLMRRLSSPARGAVSLSLRAVIRATDTTICVSQAEHDYLAAIVGRTSGRAIVIHNGVRLVSPRREADRIAVRRELGFAASEPVGIWIGSLDERKDPLMAIRAAEGAPVGLLVVGDGPLRPQAERAAQRHALVLGQRSDVPRLLAAADFYVLTSHREGLAFSLLEAMAHGVAPVVTDLNENIEAVGEAGVVVPRGDEKALVSALRQLAEDGSKRKILGGLSRERIAEHFDAEEMILRTRAVYDEVLAG